MYLQPYNCEIEITWFVSEELIETYKKFPIEMAKSNEKKHIAIALHHPLVMAEAINLIKVADIRLRKFLESSGKYLARCEFFTKSVVLIALDCEQRDLTNDRDQPIWFAPLGQEFPAPLELYGLDLGEQSQEKMNVFSKALWFGRDAVGVVGLCTRLTNVDGWLPCGVNWRHWNCFQDCNILAFEIPNYLESELFVAGCAPGDCGVCFCGLGLVLDVYRRALVTIHGCLSASLVTRGGICCAAFHFR